MPKASVGSAQRGGGGQAGGGQDGGGGAPTGVSLTWKASDSMTWTNSSTLTASSGSNQSASLTLACPSPDYTGPTQMDVYWDTIYSSFLFAPHDSATDANRTLLHQGRVLTADDAPMANQLVELRARGKTYHTVSDRAGRYRFLARSVPPSDALSGEVAVGDKVTPVNLGSDQSIDIRLGERRTRWPSIAIAVLAAAFVAWLLARRDTAVRR